MPEKSHLHAVQAGNVSPDTADVTKQKGVGALYTDYGYIGRADGIEYATEAEALEANPRN